MFIVSILQGKTKAGNYPMNIQEIKNEISLVNDEMLRLFIRQLELAKMAGDIRKEEGKSVYDRKCEEEIIVKAVENSPQDMQNYTIEFFRNVMKLCKDYYND